MEFIDKVIEENLPTYKNPYEVTDELSFSTHMGIQFVFNPEDWNFFPQMWIKTSLDSTFNVTKEVWSYESYDNDNLFRKYHVEHEAENPNHEKMLKDAKGLFADMKMYIGEILMGELPIKDFTELWITTCELYNFK